jgi:hypothetical protein
MSANDNLEITADQMKAMLGAPRLIRGESEEAYWKWWLAFVEAYKPKSLPDWVEVNELANKNWEQDRLRRCSPALVDGMLVKALTNLLEPFSKIGISPYNLARDYYGGDDKARRRAREKVTWCGITDDQILAEAMQMRGSALVLLDRMDNYRASARRSLQKELERRSEARRSRPDQSESQN